MTGSSSESRNSLVRICKLARTLDLYRDSYDDADAQDSSNPTAEATEEEEHVKNFKYDFNDQVENVFRNNGPTFRGRTNNAYTRRRTMKSKYVREKSSSHGYSEWSSIMVSPNNTSDISSSRFIYDKVRTRASLFEL